MATSRCLSGAFKFSQFKTNWASFLTKSVASHRNQTRLISLQTYLLRPSLLSSTAATSRHRCCIIRGYSENKTSDNSVDIKPTAQIRSSILGSVTGSGLGEELLRKREAKSSTDSKDKVPPIIENDSESEEKKKKDAENSWRAMKFSLIFMGVTMSGLIGFLIVVWGIFLYLLKLCCKPNAFL